VRKPSYNKVTIVVPTYNRMDLLRRTLDSISRCRAIEQAQVLVSDDGSSEPITSVVNEFSNRLDIDYIFQPDLGFRAAAARNAALSWARNPILIFLDCGMFVCCDFVVAHIEAHRSCVRPALVTGVNLGFDRDNEKANAIDALDDEEINQVFEGRHHNSAAFEDPREAVFKLCKDRIHDLSAPWTLMWTCNVSIELDAFRVIGGFNERFTSWGGEDTELAYRLARCGMHFELSRAAKAFHLPHQKDGKILQPQSVENFKRETSIYVDPMIGRLIAEGDLAVNSQIL
jgi:glycosyltransferase involved in cell wall biosynthesis